MIGVKVECSSGYKKDERPLRFVMGKRLFEVVAVDDQWYSPDAIYFRVKADDGNLYVLRHDEAQDQWRLEAYRFVAPADGSHRAAYQLLCMALKH